MQSCFRMSSWKEGLDGTSGEGMPQDHDRDRAIRRAAPARGMLLRAALGAALIGAVAGLDTSTARAGDDSSDDQSILSKFMYTMGLKRPPDTMSDINYSERSPLVVPPTRDLPPPAAGLPPAPDWPKDADNKPHKHVRPKTAAVSPEAGAAAGQPGQPAQADQAAATPRVPNPTVEKTSVWNPKTWFSREEYATFATEPPREDLTDPPAGYRTPSPTQPYGLGPERNTKPITPENPIHAGASGGR